MIGSLALLLAFIRGGSWSGPDTCQRNPLDWMPFAASPVASIYLQVVIVPERAMIRERSRQGGARGLDRDVGQAGCSVIRSFS